MLTVADVYAYVNGRAPFDTQMDFDNAGLLTGAMDQPVTGIHVALDCTEGVIQEAEHLGANLIVTHHPLMFHARKRMTEEDAEGRLLCRLIRGHMALLAAHTNLDRAAGGINDVLAEVCGLRDTVGEEFLRVGDLPAPMEARELQAYLSDRLGTVVRLMGRAGQQVSRLGVSSGAGRGWVGPWQRLWVRTPFLAVRSATTRGWTAWPMGWWPWRADILPRRPRGFSPWRTLYKPT